MTKEAQAYDIVKAWYKRCRINRDEADTQVFNEDMDVLIELLTAALAKVQRETWEAAAKLVEQPEGDDDTIALTGCVRYKTFNWMLQRRADYCRAQDQEVQP